MLSRKTARLVTAAASTNATLAYAGQVTLCTIMGHNAAAAVRYLKIYDLAVAPTVGTSVPKLTLALAPSLPFQFDFDGYYFPRGIAYALTTGSADADAGALTANDVVGLNINMC